MSKRRRRARPETAGNVQRESGREDRGRPGSRNRGTRSGPVSPVRDDPSEYDTTASSSTESGRSPRSSAGLIQESEPRFTGGGIAPQRPAAVRGFATVSRLTFAAADSGIGFGDGILDDPAAAPPLVAPENAATEHPVAATAVSSAAAAPETPGPSQDTTANPTKSRTAAGRRRRRGRRETAGDPDAAAPAASAEQADQTAGQSDGKQSDTAPAEAAAAATTADPAPRKKQRGRRGRRSRDQGSAGEPPEQVAAASPKGESALPPGGETGSTTPLDFDEVEHRRTGDHLVGTENGAPHGAAYAVGVSTETTPLPEADTEITEIGDDLDDHLDSLRDATLPTESGGGGPADQGDRPPQRESSRARGRGRSRRSPTFHEEEDLEVEPGVGGTPSTEDRVMLINVAESDECRIAILHENRLEELYIERATSASNVGNIYKGRVTNVEPSIQAAFIDFGLPQHGFLHISDVHPMYFPNSKGEPELVGKKTPRRQRPPIQACLRPGREVIVQVIKEGIGTKGPTLSSYISLPGRFLVMMPHMDQLGVSRKIEDEDLRRRLRDMLGELSLPKGVGFIVRTAGVDRTKRDLQRDLNYLTRLWKKVERRIQSEPAPAELYKESDLVIRTIRDVYDSNLRKILVDHPAVEARVREFLSIASPRSQDIVALYSDAEPMFHRYGIESEIDKLHSRHVPLPSGGSLVIESTEALVAIDVNSGKFRIPESAEETAYRVNLEAVDEIARQLRLRDLGGLIVLDLIDMSQEKHRRAVERRLAEALKKHKERAKLLRISKFGILEMTRQRQRASFAKGMYRDCTRCGGTGRVKATETVVLDVMRRIRLASHTNGVASIDVSLAPAVATELLNRKRHQLTDLERATGQTIRIHPESEFAVDEVRMSCTDRRGREVPGATIGPPPPPAGPVGRNPLEPPPPRPNGPPPGPSHAPRNGNGGRRRGRRRR